AFDFDTSYAPASRIERLLVGTPPVISLAALDAGIELFEQVDLRLVRAKSVALGTLFRHLVTQECAGLGLTLVSPADAGQCGSQVSYAHSDGYAVIQALIERQVIGDFRGPDVMRFGFAPSTSVTWTCSTPSWRCVTSSSPEPGISRGSTCARW